MEGWQLFQTLGMLAQCCARWRSASGSCGHFACGKQRDPLCESYTFFGAKQERSLSFPSLPGDRLLINWALKQRWKVAVSQASENFEFYQGILEREWLPFLGCGTTSWANASEQAGQCGMRKRHCWCLYSLCPHQASTSLEFFSIKELLWASLWVWATVSSRELFFLPWAVSIWFLNRLLLDVQVIVLQPVNGFLLLDSFSVLVCSFCSDTSSPALCSWVPPVPLSSLCCGLYWVPEPGVVCEHRCVFQNTVVPGLLWISNKHNKQLLLFLKVQQPGGPASAGQSASAFPCTWLPNLDTASTLSSC